MKKKQKLKNRTLWRQSVVIVIYLRRTAFWNENYLTLINAFLFELKKLCKNYISIIFKIRNLNLLSASKLGS